MIQKISQISLKIFDAIRFFDCLTGNRFDSCYLVRRLSQLHLTPRDPVSSTTQHNSSKYTTKTFFSCFCHQNKLGFCFILIVLHSLFLFIFVQKEKKQFNRVFSKWFGKPSCMMVRRLPKCFVGQLSRYFRCLWVVYSFCECICTSISGRFHS